jgi:serine/threonine protein kinase
MIDLSRYELETLWEDGEFVLSRCMPDGEPPLLVVASALAQPAPGSLTRLEREYALRDELDPAWAARPVEWVLHRGQPALVLEDTGGELPARLLGKSQGIRSFLQVAIDLTAALGQVHRRGLIPKDIKPPNILVNTATGEAWPTGFGIASRIAGERQTPDPPEVIAGTLADMAPEQIGRMNRSIDSRSDLCSVGITLYQMLVVQDSATGIDSQNLEKIFDTFYTTKLQGMGMGLAISRSIVENHGGRLWAVPNDGSGATFQFTLQACGK